MFGSKDPGKEKKAAHWTVEKLKDGGQFNGWIAGKMIGVYVHFMKASKPCYEELTNEELSCPYHRDSPEPRWVGYLPLYDESGKPVVVLIHKNHQPQVEQLLLHEPVRVRRGKGKFDTIIVEPSKWAKRYSPGKSGRHISADIRPWLLNVLWKDGELILHFAKPGKAAKLDPLPYYVEPEERGMSNREALKGGNPDSVLQRFKDHVQKSEAETAKPMEDVISTLNGKLFRKD